MRSARETLKGKWGLAIGTFVVYLLISIFPDVLIRIISFLKTGYLSRPSSYTPLPMLISLIVSGPFTYGIANFSLSLSRNGDARLDQLFSGFKKFLVTSGAYMLMVAYVLLWMLLLIIPGIIAAISYSMTFYILADDDSLRASEALNKSKKMMDGYKLKYFYLQLRYLGLGLLCILTLGIGFFWLAPFISVCNAKFYEDVKGNMEAIDAI